jgi:hypothetical protein
MMENLVEWRLAEETEALMENLPQRNFVHHKFHLPDPSSNPGRSSGKPATNRLSYGAAYATIMLSVCLSIPPVNLWMPKTIFMKFGMHMMILKPTTRACFINPSHQSVCLYVFQYDRTSSCNDSYFFNYGICFKCPLMFWVRIRTDFVSSAMGFRNLISSASTHFDMFMGRIQHSDPWSNTVTVILKQNFK